MAAKTTAYSQNAKKETLTEMEHDAIPDSEQGKMLLRHILNHIPRLKTIFSSFLKNRSCCGVNRCKKSASKINPRMSRDILCARKQAIYTTRDVKLALDVLDHIFNVRVLLRRSNEFTLIGYSLRRHTHRHIWKSV